MFGDQQNFSLRIHGYGGQGVKTISLILAKGAIRDGMYAQAFPEFGPERRGAPVKAFARFSPEPIITKAPIENPSFMIILDTNTLKLDDTLSGIDEDTHLLINTKSSSEEIIKEYGLNLNYHRVHVIDSESYLKGREHDVHLSIPLIGKFIKITELVPIDKIKEVLRSEFVEKIGEKKLKISERVLDESYEQL